LVKEIWLVSRERSGWAEAGGVRMWSVTRPGPSPKSAGRPSSPFLSTGFLRERGRAREGDLVWAGRSAHPILPVDLKSDLREVIKPLLRSTSSEPSLEDKLSLYTYTAVDEVRNPSHIRGQMVSSFSYVLL
jgi:hypothetical protein